MAADTQIKLLRSDYFMVEKYEKDKYPLQEETYKIIGIAMEIHRILGKGFSEIVYKDAFEQEFKMNNVFYEREKEYSVN
jgi:hypothetical protein